MVRKMKDSGIEWLGSIPATWSLRKGKHLFRQRNEKGNRIELQLLSPTQKYGVIPQEMYEKLSGMTAVKLDASADYSALKSIYAGDFCISLRSFQGGFEYSQYNGVVSPAYQVFYKTNNLCDVYYRYLFKERGFVSKMTSYTKTFRDGKSISFTDFGNSLIPVPPIEEQVSIAAFLDSECARIDDVIEKTKASIEEYKKLKQAIITEAVTKGIRPNRKMKYSGIEWVEEIPEEWGVSSITSLFDYIGGYAFSSERFCENTENQVLRIGNIKNDDLRLNERGVFIDDEYAEAAKGALVNPDDIIFTMTGTKGKQDYFYTVLVKDSDTGNRRLFINQRVGIFRKKELINAEYYNYMLKDKELRNYIFLYETGTANQGNIGISTLGKTKLVVPPIAEQEEIADYLDEKCSSIDTLIGQKEHLLAEIESYKKSIIYEYVTGKKEVLW